MLADKVKKSYRHLFKRFSRQNIDVFRLYDWDIPEIRAVVDWYAGHLVIGEYTRKQTVDHWLPMMADAVAEALQVPADRVHLKLRYYGYADGKRYERIDHTDEMITVSERDLKFLVNPNDFVDTGLFSDHRDTRQMVRQEVRDRTLLNLYCYSGAFTCAAAQGGAAATVSVDRSKNAVSWTRRNLELNDFDLKQHQVIQYDVMDYIAIVAQRGQRFDLVVLDPPSFSIRKSRESRFDIQTDHPALLSAVTQVTEPGGTIYFSTNHQQFNPDFSDLSVRRIDDITEKTIPEDYRHKRKTIHRCWKITV